MLKLLAFVLPLGLDSFAVAAAIGAIKATSPRQRLRISLVFVIFEGGMPLVGLGLGNALAHGIGHVADYLAAAAVISIGAWMLLAGDKDDEKASRLTESHGLALIALGLSISLDELAIGFTIGLARLPITTVIVAIALQAFLAAQLGLAISARIGERWRERTEQLAGIQGLGIVALCPFYSCRVESEGLGDPGGVPGVVRAGGCDAGVPGRFGGSRWRADRGCQVIWLWPSGRFRRIL